MKNPHDVTADLEEALCEYTGAPFAVAVNSCTNALLIALVWFRIHKFGRRIIEIPKRTYVGVAHSIVNSGNKIAFREEDWRGSYQLFPTPIWDSARRFTKDMYVAGQMQCVSFHISKILGADQGGAILLDDKDAADELRRMRFDGRTAGMPPDRDVFDVPGYHCYLSPPIAAQLLWKLQFLPRVNEDLPKSDYPDLSEGPWFQAHQHFANAE